MKKLLIVVALSFFGLNAMEEGTSKVDALVTSYIRPGIIGHDLKHHPSVSHNAYREQADAFIKYAKKHPFPSGKISTKDSKTLFDENGQVRGNLQDLKGHFRWNALKNTVSTGIGGLFTYVFFYRGFYFLSKINEVLKLERCYPGFKADTTDASIEVLIGLGLGAIGLKFTLNRIRDGYRDYSKLRTTQKLLSHNARIEKVI